MKNSKVLYLILGLIFGSFLKIMFDDISEETAIEYTSADLKKIGDSRYETKGKVNYDYLFKGFSISKTELLKHLDQIETGGWFYIKFIMDKNSNGEFSNFNLVLSGLNAKKEAIDTLKDSVLGKNLTKEGIKLSAINYNEAFELVKENNTLFKKIIGHNHDFDDGVIFDVESCKKYLDSVNTSKFFLFPALAPFKDKPKKSFTTVIFTSDSLLRQKWLFNPEIKSENTYADRGGACCQ